MKVDATEINALRLTVVLTRVNRSLDPEHRVYAPRYPKPQTEGFFVLVTDARKGDVVALKRAAWPAPANGGGRGAAAAGRGVAGGKPTVRTLIRLPEEEAEGERLLNVRVVSDSYIGMEWAVDGVEVPAAPRVVDEGKKG